MRFSLRNLLMAIIFMAAFLGLLLADHDAKLKRQAILFQQQRELIERSKSFPSTHYSSGIRPKHKRAPAVLKGIRPAVAYALWMMQSPLATVVPNPSPNKPIALAVLNRQEPFL